MKTNMARMICLVLAVLMAVSVFVACKPEETVTTTDVTNTDVTSTDEPAVIEVDEDAPFEIVQDANGKDVVILTPAEDGTTVMTVAEKTTLEAFLACVLAKDGYTVKVSDKDGNEITDPKAIIAKGMTFAVYKDGTVDPEVQYVIDVATKAEIAEAVEEQKKIDEKKDEGNSKPGTKPGKKPTNPKNPPIDAKDPYKNQTVVLGSVWQSKYIGSDATGKAWQSTFTSMKKKHNCTTKVNQVDPASATDLIVKEVMAGKASADVFEISLVMCRNVAKKKASCDMYSSKTLKKALFKTGATESVTFNGKAYGVAFAGSVNPMGVIYNKDMIKKYAKEYDIVKLYKEKKWNFDTFQAIAKACTQDTSGDGKTDIYGFTSNTNIIGMALTSNAGGTALMVNNRVQATMCNDAGIAALQWCKTMFKTDKSWLYKADIIECVSQFVNHKAAMFVSYMQYYPNIAAQADFNLGFVLMPMGPAQKEYKNGTYDAALYVVPKTKQSRLEVVSAWLNDAANVSGKLMNIKIKDLARNGFDSTAQGIVKWLTNNMTPEFSSGCFSGTISAAVDGSVTSATKDPAKVMASIKSQAQKECDDYYSDLYK